MNSTQNQLFLYLNSPHYYLQALYFLHCYLFYKKYTGFNISMDNFFWMQVMNSLSNGLLRK